MLTIEQIESNKNEFIALINSINREGANIEALIKKLEKSDFFFAPSSTKYHCAYEGGLVEHSLNTYCNLVALANRQGLDEECYDDNTLKIVALLHDISKMNIYEKYTKNEKKYSPSGSKYDNKGNFDWVAVDGWTTKENKFVYGSHEMTSEYIIRQYIPLTLSESIAVLHHMGGKGFDSAQDNIATVFNQYNLATLLHLADMMATYIDERNTEE